MKPILLMALAAALYAQPARALDVRVIGLTVADAATGDTTKLLVGRKLLVRCRYEYANSQGPVPAWSIELEADGKTIGTYPAEPPPYTLPSYNPATKSFGSTIKQLWVEGFVTPKAAGEHKARCILDPGKNLQGADTNPSNNTQTTSFAVDVAPTLSIPKTPGPTAASPAGAFVPPSQGGFAPAPATTQAQAPTPVLADPKLTFGLSAHVLPNCGLGQDVVAVTGTISNVGSGFAAIPPGSPVIKINAAVGVYGSSISTGNLAPGQTVKVGTHLKPKGQPASLAGATLKLDAQALLKGSWWSGNYQYLTVVFPADYCKSPPATTTGSRPVVAPTGRSAPK